MKNGKHRTIKICSCGKEIKSRRVIKKHKDMGHKIGYSIGVGDMMFVKRFEMGIVAVLMLLLIIPSGFAQNAVITTGTCLSNDQIRYDTYFTVNGEVTNITNTVPCEAGCMVGGSEHGDTCSPNRNEIPVALLMLWGGLWLLIIWFWKLYGTDIVPTLILTINALGGLLISQHIIMWIPLGVTVSLLIMYISRSVRKETG